MRLHFVAKVRDIDNSSDIHFGIVESGKADNELIIFQFPPVTYSSIWFVLYMIPCHLANALHYSKCSLSQSYYQGSLSSKVLSSILNYNSRTTIILLEDSAILIAMSLSLTCYY